MAKGQKLSKGMNSTRERYEGCCYARHAEMEAIMRLPPRKNKNNRKPITIVVIRVDKRGELKNSRPCGKCIDAMSILRGYKVKKVYYSTEVGEIRMERLSSLEGRKRHISRRFR